MDGYKKAGVVSLFCFLLGFFMLIISPIDGYEILGIPAMIVLGLVAATFWWKGFNGNAADKKWVDENF